MLDLKFVASVSKQTPESPSIALAAYHRADDEVPVVLRLRPPSVADGRVVTPYGEPLVGVTVRIEQLGGLVFREPVYSARRQLVSRLPGWPSDVVTNADGRFSFASMALTRGTKLVFSAPGCAPEVVWVTGENEGAIEARYHSGDRHIIQALPRS